MWEYENIAYNNTLFLEFKIAKKYVKNKKKMKILSKKNINNLTTKFFVEKVYMV